MKYFLCLASKILVIVLCCHSGYLQANLLISPTRVSINDRERATTMVLINNGDKTRSYRLGWEQKSVLENGNYHTLTPEEISSFPTASNMIRFSPKQVSLAPGERQTIRLAVRRPKGLAAGEYRSHLLLTALPPKTKTKANGMEIKLNVLLSYSLPVVVRQGAMDAQVNFTSLAVNDLAAAREPQRVEILAKLSRTGKNSVTGNMLAYWQPVDGGAEVIVSRVHDYTIYPDQKQYDIKLNWEEYTPTAGKLRLAFEGVKEFRNQLLAETSIQLDPHVVSNISASSSTDTGKHVQ